MSTEPDTLRAAVARGDLARIGPDALTAFLVPRRWFASGRVTPIDAAIVGAVPLSMEPPLTVAIVEARFPGGTHQTYQLVLGVREPSDADGAILRAGDEEVYDALTDPHALAPLLARVRASADVTGDDGMIECRAAVGAAAFDPLPASARSLAVEQSNSSVVFADRMILKGYRRLDAGVHPEVEVLQALNDRGFAHMPPLYGWYEYRGPAIHAALGVIQGFRRGAVDGWQLALDMLRADNADGLLPHVGELGTVVGRMHAALGADHPDPAFAPEEVSPESLVLIGASLDELTNDVFGSLTDAACLDPLRHRREDIRDLVGTISKSSGLGRRIRLHGDLHLGQALWWEHRWEIIDFEGEPTRPISERRRKQSPLRDVAGMLRSIAYVDGAARHIHGADVPRGWRAAAREAFLERYLDAAEPSGLLPPTRGVLNEILALYELEKAVYELRYEMEHRHAWLPIPAESLLEMIEPE